jgi:hypothetical protein
MTTLRSLERHGAFAHTCMAMLRTCVFAVALSTFVGSTFIQGTVLAEALSKPATAIKKKKGQSCPPNTNDCSPQLWCCVKPSICIRGGCSQR